MKKKEPLPSVLTIKIINKILKSVKDISFYLAENLSRPIDDSLLFGGLIYVQQSEINNLLFNNGHLIAR